MWPKLLLDLLPHFSRLLPVADKYLARINANESAQSAELAALSVDVRKQMTRATETQAGVARQLQQQSTQIGEIAVDVARTRMGVEGAEERIGKLENRTARLEKSMGTALRLLWVAVALLAITLALVVVRMVR